MRKLLITLAALPLAGCVTSQMNDGLGFMVGQNIDYAVSRLGYPDGQREMLGDMIYVWSSNRSGIMPLQTTENTNGMVGNTPVWGQTTGTTFVPVSYACTIQMAVGPDHIIKSWQWQGNMAGCQPYARALRHQ